jgi:dTDP-4-amino-4,6-dideoxygalactose transaminase
MSNIVAGIGRGQMAVLPSRIERRREINQWYRNLLADVPGITFQSEPGADLSSRAKAQRTPYSGSIGETLAREGTGAFAAGQMRICAR